MKHSIALAVTALLLLMATSAVGGKRKGKGKKFNDVNAEVVEEEAIEIRLRGLESNEGWVVCKLYDKAGWLKKATKTVSAPIERRAAVCVFEKVRPGTYGVAAFHDANKNGEPDTNGVGQPGEGVCTTNNVKEIKTKPSFKKARFTYAGGLLVKAARMRYL